MSDEANKDPEPPCWPTDLHELEHNTAADPRGAVMYFASEDDKIAFMTWMTLRAVGNDGAG